MIALWYMLPESTQFFLKYIVSGANLPYTALLGMIMLYWLLVILGALDIELFDIDIDTDLEAPDGFLQSFLAIFNIGELPVMIVATFIIFGLWTSAIFAHFLLPSFVGGGVALIALPINLVAGTLFGWVTMKPVAVFFSKNRDRRRLIQIVGNMGKSRFSMGPGESGQVELAGNPSPIVVNVLVADTSEQISKGDQVVILKDLGQKKYLAKKWHDDFSEDVELLVKRKTN